MVVADWEQIRSNGSCIGPTFIVAILAMFCLFTTFLPSLAQTYTTSGLSDNWDNPAAWIITNPDNCPTPNSATTPPLGPVFFPACPIRIVINHPISRTATNSNFGGGLMVSMTINYGGRLSTTGNMGLNSAFQIQLNDGAQLNVNGTLSLQSGATLNMVNAATISPKTKISATNLTFLDNDIGHTVSIGANTLVEIQSQTSLSGGGTLNIQGSLSTATFNSANSGNQVNLSGNGTINTSGNMQINGLPMTLSGNAGVVVSGILNTNAGTALSLLGPATGFVVLGFGSTIVTQPTGTCFQTPENGQTCASQACLEIRETAASNILNVPQGFDRIYIFRCSYDWTIPNDTDTEEILDDAEILIVAGGGGGGFGTSAGGGGAGGLRYIASELLTPGSTVPIAVGKGGPGSTVTSARGQNGGNSSFGSTFTAIGGGGGGSTDDGFRNGNSGGSGGGSAHGGPANGGTISGGTRIDPPVQGNDGGSGQRQGNSSTRSGGGGGGSGSNGFAGSGANGGFGGSGFESSITNSTLFYAAGGGGIGTNGNQRAGGSGIGGTGNGSGIARHGRPNTGSGGGATSDLAGGGNGADGMVIVRQSYRILPVEFLYIDANFRREHREVLVTWATGKEWNNSHFEIQRSEDGLKTWKTLDNVPGKGWSDAKTEYRYVDGFPPLIGGLLYYRIKQVDFDGRFALSKVVAVRVPQLIETKGTWIIYPNPVRNLPVRLELVDAQGYLGQEISIRIIHPMGEAVSKSGTDLEALQTWMSGVFSRGQRGVYVVEISWGKYREYHKVIAQD